MPLTDHEKFVLSDFLNNMEESVLCRVAAAVTHGSMSPKSRAHAFECVMLHAESLFQVLNLKRVSQAVLLRYLNHLREPVPGTATKDEMLHKLYQKWNLPHPSKNVYQNPPPTVAPQYQYSYPHAPALMPVSHYVPTPMPFGNYNPALMPANSTYMPPGVPNHQFEMMMAAARSATMNHDPLLEMTRSKKLLEDINSLSFNEYIVNFAQTFYDLLNNPSGNSQWLHGFDDSHFFVDCKLKIMIKGASEDIETEGEGINNVFSALSELKKEHQLLFKPNLTEQGVRSKQDSHGLVSAVVCGTLHQRTGPVGVFEQCFIISADPFAKGSYKILETVLILRSSNAVSSVTQLMLNTSDKKNDHRLALEFEAEASAPRSASPLLAIKD